MRIIPIHEHRSTSISMNCYGSFCRNIWAVWFQGGWGHPFKEEALFYFMDMSFVFFFSGGHSHLDSGCRRVWLLQDFFPEFIFIRNLPLLPNRDGHELLIQHFMLVWFLSELAFGTSQANLLKWAWTQRQYLEEVTQGSQSTASEWVSTREGRAAIWETYWSELVIRTHLYFQAIFELMINFCGTRHVYEMNTFSCSFPLLPYLGPTSFFLSTQVQERILASGWLHLMATKVNVVGSTYVDTSFSALGEITVSTSGDLVFWTTSHICHQQLLFAIAGGILPVVSCLLQSWIALPKLGDCCPLPVELFLIGGLMVKIVQQIYKKNLI